ncbi:MAG: alpha-ribazole phosphatase [Raineya sp.]|jgi:alpha-ribazole phosphatase|nr:alpha-ribazole phosphatase [Raineya sp.]
MEIYIVRHTQVNVAKNICYGQTDVGLADTFLEEAGVLKSKLPENIELVYSSPLSRCKKLAEYLHERLIFDENLMEMHFGDWELKSWDEIDSEQLNTWMNDFVNISTPNGENLSRLYERTSIFLDELRTKPHTNIMLVTHGGIIRCIWAYVLEIPLQNIFKMPVHFGEVFKLKLGKDKNRDSIQKWR